MGVTDYGNAVNGNGGNYSYSRQFMLGDTHIFTPTILNDLRSTTPLQKSAGTFGPEYDAKSGANLSTEYGLPSLTHGGVPNMAVGLGSYGGIGAGGPPHWEMTSKSATTSATPSTSPMAR